MLRTPNVTLACLSNLTHLCLPVDALLFMDRRPIAVDRALPSNLRRLQIKPCSRFISLVLPGFAMACIDGLFPKLCQVDCHFQGSLKDSLGWIDQGRGILSSIRDVTILLKKECGISLRGYNDAGICTGDFLEELDAWSHLSTTELWYPSEEGAEFSSIVARTKKGAPRRRSAEEIRTYIKRDRLSRKSVFTRRYIFNPDVNLQVIAPRSFSTDSDKLPKVMKPTFTSEFACWLASVAAAQRVSGSTFRGASTHASLDLTAEGKGTGKRSVYTLPRS